MKIYFLTVHWGSDDWIDVQTGQIAKTTVSPYEIYAFANFESPLNKKFTHCFQHPIKEHWVKLNLLAQIACLRSVNDEDWLVFLDSDAFPIKQWEDSVQSMLDRTDLVAVQRKENLGDEQPHPCFCVTTVGFWKRINGDWTPGFRWKNDLGDRVTDVGGNLLGQLEREDVQWHRIMRSASCGDHPLFFGVYGGIVYHHGAGSRSAFSRLDHYLLEHHYSSWYMWLLRATRQRKKRIDVAARENGRLAARMKERLERDLRAFLEGCHSVEVGEPAGGQNKEEHRVGRRAHDT